MQTEIETSLKEYISECMASFATSYEFDCELARLKHKEDTIIMAHWFNTKPTNKSQSLKEMLVANTTNFASGREVRLNDAVKETFDTARRDFLNYSVSNYGYDYWLRPFSSGNNSDGIRYRLLKQLSFADRDEVLSRVAKLFREEGLECHTDSDSIHLIWK